MGPIIGILAAGRQQSTSEYFTTVLYPFESTDALAVNQTSLIEGPNTFARESPKVSIPTEDTSISLPTIVSGFLREIVVTVDYNQERLAVNHPKITKGELTETLKYTINPEAVSISLPTITAGSLTDIVVRVDYAGGAEPLSIKHPSIISGTLQ